MFIKWYHVYICSISYILLLGAHIAHPTDLIISSDHIQSRFLPDPYYPSAFPFFTEKHSSSLTAPQKMAWQCSSDLHSLDKYALQIILVGIYNQ